MVLRISPMVSFSPRVWTIAGSSASTTRASSPSSDSSLPRMISLERIRFDQRLVFRAFRQFGGKQRRGKLIALGRLAGGEERDDAAGAVDQLNLGHEIAQPLEILPRQQVLALDDDQHVVLRSTGSGA